MSLCLLKIYASQTIFLSLSKQDKNLIQDLKLKHLGEKNLEFFLGCVDPAVLCNQEKKCQFISR